MKRTILTLMCLVCLGSMAQAATLTVNPSGGTGVYTTISAAITAASANDTINITSNTTFVEQIIIAKPLNIVAPAGISPKIQNTGTTTGAMVQFQAGSEGTKFGSVSGGQIILYCNKAASNNPTAFVQFKQTTDTLVTVENVQATVFNSVTTGASPYFVMHDYILRNKVVLNYVDINLNTPSTVSSGSYGIAWGSNSYTPTMTGKAPTYTLNHVRIKGYTRSAIWFNYTDVDATISYCENDALGVQYAAGSYSWSGIQNLQPPTRYTARIDHSIFRGHHGISTSSGDAIAVAANGSSVTLSRCVLISKVGADTATTYWRGALRLGMSDASGLTGVPYPGKTTVTADHCDFIDLNQTGANYGAIIKGTNDSTWSTVTLSVTNSNIYSQSNKAVNLNFKAGESFTSDYNNVYSGSGAANVGYTKGAHDQSRDPYYTDAPNSDVRYSDNLLKTADSAGGAIGTLGDYSDIWGKGIVIGPGPMNRAHGWATLK